MNAKLEHLFNNADAEFWLQLDDGLAERFGEMVREYLEEDKSSGQVKFILKDYRRWRDSK